jgi:hypothetical protein
MVLAKISKNCKKIVQFTLEEQRFQKSLIIPVWLILSYLCSSSVNSTFFFALFFGNFGQFSYKSCRSISFLKFMLVDKWEKSEIITKWRYLLKKCEK